MTAMGHVFSATPHRQLIAPAHRKILRCIERRVRSLVSDVSTQCGRLVRLHELRPSVRDQSRDPVTDTALDLRLQRLISCPKVLRLEGDRAPRVERTTSLAPPSLSRRLLANICTLHITTLFCYVP